MPIDLSKSFVIAISSRALYDLELENDVFEKKGIDAYITYQREHENEILKPGTGFPLVNAILSLNKLAVDKRKTEVIIVSRNNADACLRILNSNRHYSLDITRGAYTSGDPVAKYLQAYEVGLFLSASEEDVKNALQANVPSGLIYSAPSDLYSPIDQIRIAFDGDAVIFSEESELIFKNEGLTAFLQHEKTNALNPLPEGPFAKLLRTISFLQSEFKTDPSPIRTALITARNSPADERVIRTLRTWNVRVDEVFFMGGVTKDKILSAFNPHIFFDDQDLYCSSAAKIVPTARVPSFAKVLAKQQRWKNEIEGRKQGKIIDIMPKKSKGNNVA